MVSAVSTKPYLIRAIYEWCLDQGFTPYLAAIVDEHTRVPAGAARDGQIVLNVSPDATHQLDMGNDFIQFQARFSGKAQMLTVPVSNVIAVYARENGHGMAFEVERGDAAEASAPLEAAEDEGAEADESVDSASPPEDAPPPPEGPAGGRAHLKLIK